MRRQQADPDLGQQPDHLEPAFLDARAGSEAPRRAAGRDRPVPQRAPPRSATSTSRCMPGTDAALALGMMHVLIRDGLVDRDYVERYTLGFDALRRARAPNGRRSAWRRSAASRPTQIERARARLRHDTPGGDPRQLRHAAARRRRQRRARDRLPAGADRRVARSGRRRAALVVGHLSRSTRAALERPDLIRGRPRTINMSAIGDALHDADAAGPSAIFVYNSNPVAVAPESAKVRAGLRARRPVHRRPRAVPDRHRRLRRHPAAGDDAARARRHPQFVRPPVRAWPTTPSIAPLGEALPQHRGVPAAGGARWASTSPASATATTTSRARRSTRDDPRMRGLDWDALKRDGFRRLNVPDAVRAVRAGRLPDAVGQVRVLSRDAARRTATIRCPHVIRRANRAETQSGARARAIRWRSSRRRRATSSTRRSPTCPRSSPRKARRGCVIHPDDAAPRGIAAGDWVRIHNDRGAFHATARVSDRARPGVVVAPSIWWQKLVAGRRERQRGDRARR